MYAISSVKQHQLFSEKDKYKSAIDSIALRNDKAKSHKSRLASLIDYLYTNVEKSEDIYIPTTSLKGAHDALEAMRANINNFNNNPASGYLTTAIDDLGRAVQYFQTPYFSRFASLNNNHLSKFESKLNGHLVEFEESVKSIEEQLSTNKNKLQSISESADKVSDRIASVVEGFNQTFDESQSQRRNNFKEEIEIYNNDLKLLIQEGEKSYDEVKNKANEFIDHKNKEYNSYFKSFKARIDITLEDVKSKHDEILKLYEITGNAASTGAYQQEAKRQGIMADWLRGIAIALMVAAVLTVAIPYAYSIIAGVGNGFGWMQILERVPITTLLLVPAFYSARESGKHRELEREYKMLQLQITTLGPYLEGLTANKQKDVRESLVEKFFYGRPGKPEKAQKEKLEGSEPSSETIESLRKLIEAVLGQRTP